MSKLDELFENNKASFDRLEPRDSSWKSIHDEYKKRKPARPQNKIISLPVYLLKIAATLLFIVGLSYFLTPNDQATHSTFKDIALHSPQGATIPLDPSMNKITLVQFWESGNVLCTSENCYYYLPAYEKYKDQGFEIYAISLDKDKESWVLGIEENELPWIHVSDLMGWDSPICIECNITKTPTSFLLDQQGNVIAHDLDAEDLDRTLGQLLAQN